MKALFFSASLLLLLSINAWSQSDLLNTRIHIKLNNNTFKEVVQTIEKQYDIHFSYSDNILSDTLFVKDEYINISLQSFLDENFKKNNIHFKQVGKNIVLYYKQDVQEWISVSGFIKDANSSEDLIGAAIYVESLKVGTITNPYGFFSLKLPTGKQTILIYNLGYVTKSIELNLFVNQLLTIEMQPQKYPLEEITVSTKPVGRFLESTLNDLAKIDIGKMQQLPGLLGENDALRNLSILPGIQINELSTSSINVRGGGPDQTVFLMDEANLYNASHFGGFFSVFNPDMVNNITLFKSEIPVSEGGALSSLIDVRLREGNNQQWQVSGGIGIISARGSVEGPLKKNESSMIFAFRRTYVDRVAELFSNDPDMKQMKFYFYDANLKLNIKLNPKNRMFLSGYSGSDSFDQYQSTLRTNHLGSVRWNHIFGNNVFSNISFIVSQNIMSQGTQEGKELLYWRSSANNVKLKTEISYDYSDVFKSTFGFTSNLYNIYPFSLITETEELIYTRYESSLDQMLLNSFFYSQHVSMDNKFSIDAGLRLNHLFTDPFSDSLIGVKSWLIEPQLRFSIAMSDKTTLKASYGRQIQPLHQLPLSAVGVSTNRWMIANESFPPQISDNIALGVNHSMNERMSFLVETYFRTMQNLIENMQDRRILYTEDPEKYLYRSNATVTGIELLFSYNFTHFKGMVSYDYCHPLWKTEGLNNNQVYPASHTRQHTFNLAGVYMLNQRASFSATWVFASGIPYTAAVGKYQVDNKTYLQFDENHINSKNLPPYHRLDISFDLASKKNESRRWKSYWNFAVYNIYLRKNALGIAYYIPSNEENNNIQVLNPSYFYMYQFVPSISYRFKF